MSISQPIIPDPASYLDIVKSRIIRQFRPLKIVLFGSQGRGEATQHSDLDLLVVLPEVDSKRRAAIAIRRCLADLPIAKDIVVTTPEEIARRGHVVGTLLCAALEEGKVLYEQA